MKRSTATLDRLVEPVVRTLTPEVAKAITELRADPELQSRMDEYETNIRFGNFLAIIQAKARRMLKQRASRK
jgi:hypothetical protein